MAYEWRPENWRDPFKHDGVIDVEWETFEAGADAMHKAIVEWLEDRRLTSITSTFSIRERDWQEFKKGK